VTSTLGCSSLYIRPKTDDNIKDIKDKIIKIEREIPREFLKRCQEDAAFEGTSLSELAEIVIENKERAESCRVLHNSFVDYYNSSQNKD
jgi:hypothetical protein